MTTGHADSLLLHLSMKDFEMMKQEIELKNLNLLIGANGVGKTLIMKLTWVLNMISQLVVLKQPLKEGAQFIIDNSVPETQMMGTIGLKYSNGAAIKVELLDGKVTGVDYLGFEKIDQPQKCIYMSAEMRLFSAIKRYCGLRKSIGAEKMVEHYKLYDVCYIEGLIPKMPLILDKRTRHILESIDVKDLLSIEFDDEFIGVFKDDKKALSLLGNGHQAIINMIIGGL